MQTVNNPDSSQVEKIRLIKQKIVDAIFTNRILKRVPASAEIPNTFCGRRLRTTTRFSHTGNAITDVQTFTDGSRYQYFGQEPVVPTTNPPAL